LIELLEQAQERLSEDTRDWEMADAVEEARCRLQHPKDFSKWPIASASDAPTMVEMNLWDIAYAWSLAPSMNEQWLHFNKASFTGAMGCLGWGFACDSSAEQNT
jgi:hypothetical protein